METLDTQSLPFSSEKQRAVLYHTLFTPGVSDAILSKVDAKWFADPLFSKLYGVVQEWNQKTGTSPTAPEIIDSQVVMSLDPVLKPQLVALVNGLEGWTCPYKSEPIVAEMTVWAQARSLQINIPKLVKLFNSQKFDEAAAALTIASEEYERNRLTAEEDLMAFVDCEKLRDEARALPAERYVVDQLVCASGIELVVGPSNAGKSWVAQYIAQCAVAQGRDVLFIEEEGDKRSMGKRLDFFDVKGVTMALNGGYKLTNQLHVNKIKKWVSTHKDPVVILDPLIALHSGDENSSQEMTLVMEALKTILRAKNKDSSDCLVVVLHHVAKGKDGGSGIDKARGSSSIPAAADHQLNVEGVKQEEGARKVVVNVQVTKNRNGERWQERTITFNLDGSKRVDVERATGSSVVNSISQPILNYLAEGQKGFTDIRKSVGKQAAVVREVLRKMVDQGAVQTSMDADGRTVLYSLSQTGSINAQLNGLV